MILGAWTPWNLGNAFDGDSIIAGCPTVLLTKSCGCGVLLESGNFRKCSLVLLRLYGILSSWSGHAVVFVSGNKPMLLSLHHAEKVLGAPYATMGTILVFIVDCLVCHPHSPAHLRDYIQAIRHWVLGGATSSLFSNLIQVVALSVVQHFILRNFSSCTSTHKIISTGTAQLH